MEGKRRGVAETCRSHRLIERLRNLSTSHVYAVYIAVLGIVLHHGVDGSAGERGVHHGYHVLASLVGEELILRVVHFRTERMVSVVGTVKGEELLVVLVVDNGFLIIIGVIAGTAHEHSKERSGMEFKFPATC